MCQEKEEEDWKWHGCTNEDCFKKCKERLITAASNYLNNIMANRTTKIKKH